MLYETNSSLYIPKRNYLVLNIEECLLYENKMFIRYNAKSNIELWKSIEPLKDLPSSIRIDKTAFEVIDNDFTKCIFNYTTFEGDKKDIAFKINNNTGEFVQM